MWYRVISSLGLVLVLGACSDSDSKSSRLNESIAVGGYGDEVIEAGDAGKEGQLVASRMSMVSSDQVSEAMLQWQPIDLNTFAQNSDYNLDVTQTWVNENTLDVLHQVNEILCQIDQAGYDRPEVINQGLTWHKSTSINVSINTLKTTKQPEIQALRPQKSMCLNMSF